MTSRRQFLQAFGATLALPWLPSLARAADVPAAPKRFIFLFSANGQRRTTWFPSVEPVWRDRGGGVRDARLRDLPGQSISGVIGPDLSAFRDKLTLIRGLDFPQSDAFGHFPPKALSGYPRLGQYAVTIDQVMANSRAVYGGRPHARSVHLLVQGDQAPEDPVSVSDAGGVITPLAGETDPRRAFQSLFRPTIPFASASGTQRTRRRRVLDLVRGQIDTLRQSPRLGHEDRQRLEAHLTHLHDLEGRMAGGLPDPVERCEVRDIDMDFRASGELSIPAITRAHLDIVAAAVRCDLTRVATVQLCPGTDSRWFRYLGTGQYPDDHHNLSHVTDGSADEALRQFNAWYGQQVAYLLQQLDVVEEPETGRTYLDNSIVYWGNEFGCNGWHACNAMPVLLAGGGGGALSTGRYLDYRQLGVPFRRDDAEAGGDDSRYDWAGRNYNQLLVTLLQAMGVAPDEYHRGELGGFGDYVGAELDGDPDDPLPFIAG